jgi:hypothetical protein
MNEINQVTAFMLYMFNRWCIGEAKKVFGETLGDHVFKKWIDTRNGMGTLYWYAELDKSCRKKIVERAVELYYNESKQ